jgi:hypothetical protein
MPSGIYKRPLVVFSNVQGGSFAECRMKKWKDGRVAQWNVGRKEIGNHESRIMNPGGRRIDLWKFLSENKPKEINCIRS